MANGTHPDYLVVICLSVRPYFSATDIMLRDAYYRYYY